MKKKTILTGFAVIILGIIVVMVGMNYQQQTAEGNYTIPTFPKIIGASGPYVLATSYPVVNDSYPAYKTVTPDITDEEVKRIGILFGLSGDVQDYRPSYGISRILDNSKDPYEILKVYRNSGAIRYQIPSKALPYSTDTQPDLPSDEEAREIATKYLLERDLLPDDMHFTTVSIGSQYEHQTQNSYTLYNLTKNVGFVKEIQGAYVYNAGITVTIGDNGEVVCVDRNLRELEPEPVRYVKIITPEQAYQRLLSNDVVRKQLSEDYNVRVITNISLGYWMEIPRDPQKYVLPVYGFSCVSIPENISNRVKQYVWAVEPSEMQYFT